MHSTAPSPHASLLHFAYPLRHHADGPHIHPAFLPLPFTTHTSGGAAHLLGFRHSSAMSPSAGVASAVAAPANAAVIKTKSFTIDAILGSKTSVHHSASFPGGEGDSDRKNGAMDLTHHRLSPSGGGGVGRTEAEDAATAVLRRHQRLHGAHPYLSPFTCTSALGYRALQASSSNNSSHKDKDEKKSSARGGSEWKHGKAKRVRTIFTPEQLERLEAEFERQQYMVGTERYYLAVSLNLTEAQVKVWFQNRRIKWRKQNLEQQHAKLATMDILCGDSDADDADDDAVDADYDHSEHSDPEVIHD